MNNQKNFVASVGTIMGAPIVFSLLNGGTLDANSALTFAIGLSAFSMVVIAGAAFMGAYRFLKNVGLFKGHYYY
jgi:hypothetical protein